MGGKCQAFLGRSSTGKQKRDTKVPPSPPGYTLQHTKQEKLEKTRRIEKTKNRKEQEKIEKNKK